MRHLVGPAFLLSVLTGLGCTVFLVAQNQAPARTKDRIYLDQYGATHSELMIADGDGKNARKLVPGAQIDYNPSLSSDGQWVVFTSERHGSADIFRVKPDGTGLDRLKDSPAYDDQAAISPDGKSVAFVSSRDSGSADIYLLDIASRSVRNLTNAPGGDFRPSWSPDGKTIAFSSDHGTGFPHTAGGREHLQAASIYVIGVDGTGLRKLTNDPETSAGSPWSADGKQIVFYELAVRDTFPICVGGGRGTTRIVAMYVESGVRTVRVPSGFNLAPQFVGPDRLAYLVRTGRTTTLTFSTSEKSSAGDMLNPLWSSDGERVVYLAGTIETMHDYSRTPGDKMLTRDTRFELVYGSGFPAVSPDGKTVAVSERLLDGGGDRSSLVLWNVDGTNPRRIYHDPRTVMGLDWSRDGRLIAFGAGSFFNARVRQPAQIIVIQPDGAGARTVTSGPGNAGFPSWSPDGRQIVYRYWTEAGAGGLRIVDVATGVARTLSSEYHTLPVWSPKSDLIVFNRFAKDDRFKYDEFDIYGIRPDGTGLKRLTDSEGAIPRGHRMASTFCGAVPGLASRTKRLLLPPSRSHMQNFS